MSQKVVLITGVTGAVGRGILLRLLDTFTDIKIYGTARSIKKASLELSSLVETYQLQDRINSGKVSLIPAELDTTVISTVKQLSTRLQEENEKLDLVYLNAGAIICNGIDFVGATVQFFTDIQNFSLKPSFINHDGHAKTSDGISKSFCVNVYGHYVLAELLQGLLSASGEGRLFWVGSSEGEQVFFDPQDVEGCNSINPYGSNKYCIRVVSKALNEKYQKTNLPISSIVVAPGVLPSNIAASMVPSFLVPLVIFPLMWLLRLLLGIKDITLNSFNAAESIITTTTLPASELQLSTRYDSSCTRLGTPYVSLAPSESIPSENQLSTTQHLEKLNKKFDITSSF